MVYVIHDKDDIIYLIIEQQRIYLIIEKQRLSFIRNQSDVVCICKFSSVHPDLTEPKVCKSAETPTQRDSKSEPVDMADGYWNRQPQIPVPGYAKRPRTVYEMPPTGIPSRLETHTYLTRDDDSGGPTMGTRAIGSAYDRYLQNQLSTLSSGEAARGISAVGVINGHFVPDHGLLSRYDVVSDPADVSDKPARGTLPLPRDASNTIYVEGLPSGCTKREVAHIFRPFIGYKEVRLVTKDFKHRSGDPLVLCFVDFADAACAATALSALQGYKMDENDSNSRCLRLEFSRHPGPRSSSRGRLYIM